ncbi:glycoside hydrolase family 11 protein [Aspergillus homomorphus CBS 101889]|uniref:Endo-1,4-beta-xylanase n=1 Tax=Aspergillus homomorphus (strain CBS 101889) TaxID=1450537 RepID=A0A395I063_ASPHC|nr:endo-1,4-beta-xylanase B precursor [Aspergillus homomorphus CBS 101889]RAL13186.1 endo-1,4-beta-xylanase B precursor [Aspergillus homomorphus CBS 101889]
MVSFLSQLRMALPVLSAVACMLTVATTVPPMPRDALSPERLQWIREIIGNQTDFNATSDVSKRSTIISTRKDGIDAAGFYYSLYNANGADVGYTEYPTTGQFELGWSAKTEFLGGKGYRGGNPRSLTWDGYFTAEGDWTLAIYGWTLNPVTEWYIVESHGSGTPGNGHILGQVNSDGGLYDVYSLPYRNVPKIYGVTNFDQHWSVRRSHRTSGTVDVAAHFRRWKEMGLDPGTPIFQMVTLEGFSGKGYLNFKVE